MPPEGWKRGNQAITDNSWVLLCLWSLVDPANEAFIRTKNLHFSLEIWHACRRVWKIPPERKAALTLSITILRVCASSFLTGFGFSISLLTHRLSELIQKQQLACATTWVCAVSDAGDSGKQADFCMGGPTSTSTLLQYSSHPSTSQHWASPMWMRPDLRKILFKKQVNSWCKLSKPHWLHYEFSPHDVFHKLCWCIVRAVRIPKALSLCLPLWAEGIPGELSYGVV